MAQKKPNIVLIMSDQHRGDLLGIAGNRQILTPNLDNLAATGAWFPRAYSTCPTCIAARRSMLSGQFPRSHGMVGYHNSVPWANPPSTAEVLGQEGYHTYFIGRNMHQYPPRKRFGYDHMVLNDDYDLWVNKLIPYQTGHEGGTGYADSLRYSYGTMHNDYTVHPWTYDEQLHFTNWVMMEAKKFMRIRDPEAPFFLTLSFLAPHQPLTPPPFYFERYVRQQLPQPVIGDWAVRPENDGIGLEANGVGPVKGAVSTSVCLEGELGKSALAAYYASINHIDDQIRRLIYSINGIDQDNTAVIYVSDHGEMLGDHYLWRKTVPYEGSVRIPFIVRPPGYMKSQAGQSIKEAVCLEDLMPTILDLAGAPIPGTVEGKSLLPLIMGEQKSLDRPYLHLEHAPMHQTLTDGKCKYIWFVKDGREQFFDLARDEKELHDCIAEPAYQDQIRIWRQRLITELAGRPEGFVQEGQLVAGREYRAVLQT